MINSLIDGNLLNQEFADGRVTYKLICGVVTQVSERGMAWIKWDDPDYPEEEYSYGARVGQEVVLLEARAESSSGKSPDEKLWVLNRDTKQVHFLKIVKIGELRKNTLDTPSRPNADSNFNGALNRMSKIVHTEFDMHMKKTGKNIIVGGIWFASAALGALFGYVFWGFWGLVIGGVLGEVLLGYIGVVMFFKISDSRDPGNSLPKEISKQKAMANRIEEIRQNLLKA